MAQAFSYVQIIGMGMIGRLLLDWAILREQLAPAQWAGVAIILAGVLLVSV